MASKIYRKNEFNENYMSIRQTKAILAFFAIGIILHHISLKIFTQINSTDISRYIFEPFRGLGYLLVAFFFFTSGYGLYKSSIEKENYLKGFLKKHLSSICISFFITDAFFLYARIQRDAAAFPANTYSWFVFAIIALYIGFFLCCKLLKEKALWGLVLYSILWCVICKLLILDSYWYNSVLAFPLGAIFAKYFNTLTEKIKKHYIKYLIVSLAASLILHFFAVNDMRLFGILGSLLKFDYIKELQSVLQIAAALSFVILITVLSMKFSIENKLLDFLGSMTLEIYLIHVFYVELFSKKFINSYQPFYYIQNPFLYTLIIIALTIPSAWLIYLLRKKVFPRFLSEWTVGVLKKLVITALAVFLLMTCYYSITKQIDSSKAKDAVEKYRKDFISFTEIDGKNMAAYITGQGEKTIVLLGDLTDPCPSMTLRPLADMLSDNFKVIVPDFFGCGFSDNTENQRSTENITAELHKVINSLNNGKPVSLFSFGTSGICAETYIMNYQNEVSGLIGFDMATREIVKKYYDTPSLTDEQIFYESKRFGKRKRNHGLYLKITGYIQKEQHLLNEAFKAGVMGSYFDEMWEMYVHGYANKESTEAQAHLITDSRNISAFTLPTDLPVLFISSQADIKNTNSKTIDIYSGIITNETCQKVDILRGPQYFIFYKPETIEKRIEEFLITR